MYLFCMGTCENTGLSVTTIPTAGQTFSNLLFLSALGMAHPNDRFIGFNLDTSHREPRIVTWPRLVFLTTRVWIQWDPVTTHFFYKLYAISRCWSWPFWPWNWCSIFEGRLFIVTGCMHKMEGRFHMLARLSALDHQSLWHLLRHLLPMWRRAN